MYYKEIINKLKREFPYDVRMDREKYNEWIQDLLYEEIINKL